LKSNSALRIKATLFDVVEAFVALQIVEYNGIEYLNLNGLCALISIFNKQLAMYRSQGITTFL
jgi:hypothetical protein